MEIPVERLVGRRVIDRDGRTAGRIEELRAEQVEGEWLVREAILGAAGLVERLSAGPVVRLFVGRFAPDAQRHAISWEDLDLRDPARPRLTRTVADLRRRAA